MKKKILLISSVVAVVLALAGIYWYRLQNKAKVYYWRSVSVEKGDVNVLVTATGTMAADTSVDVGVQVSGTYASTKITKTRKSA
jgi:HlyD family secretion protein